MKKVYEMKDEYLEGTVTNDGPIPLPINKEQVTIGTFVGTTVQKIDKDKVPLLIAFIKENKENAQKQIDTLQKQLDGLKDIQEIDENVVSECAKVIGKGTKIFKQKMLVLNTHIEKVTKKKQLTAQLEYMNNQIKQINSEYDDLKKFE